MFLREHRISKRRSSCRLGLGFLYLDQLRREQACDSISVLDRLAQTLGLRLYRDLTQQVIVFLEVTALGIGLSHPRVPIVHLCHHRHRSWFSTFVSSVDHWISFSMSASGNDLLLRP